MPIAAKTNSQNARGGRHAVAKTEPDPAGSNFQRMLQGVEGSRELLTGDEQFETQPSRNGRSLSLVPRNHDRKRLAILIADDHPLVREGLTALLNRQPDMRVVSEAGNGRDAV